ncbi:two-component system, OmpR family, phosphate regulon response regulator PhoB [Austwickia chelonae]|uniref:Putative two-component system response regulator n=1 Tax=Austwickia chelonae NBRC 105200 TaxID=1184607 RepID=K6ULC0_9MICO|nr:response regulator transcription factor [Austwickia chelonae]GAB77116.1 putative two-component system response regulator [Austwickia chelonae NBRC 105200]SEW03138.1 two-component system, OmpR family, phosphate regulon response regulator PhoB [Austwickia chelonae]
MRTDRAVKQRVLVVDDEPRMAELVQFALEAQGLAVVTAHDAVGAWRVLSEVRVDLVVLDVMLPGESGVDLCRRLRAVSAVPVILLTALGDTEDRVAGLEAGADDYLTKPFSPRELALRVSAVLRRMGGAGGPLGPVAVSGPAHPAVRELGVLKLDVHQHRAFVDGRELHLTPGEFRLLLALGERPGVTLRWVELAQVIGHGPEHVGCSSVVKTAIYRLRSKLDTVPGAPQIVSDRGCGYRIVVLN